VATPLGDLSMSAQLAVAIAGGYLLGSIPFGLLLTHLAGLGDIRKVGSGNIGATNVLRTGNKALAFLTLLLDCGKGAAAVLVARGLMGPDLALVAGAAAVVGHLFPVWLGFKGGKGVATGVGVLIAVSPPAGFAAMATWTAVAALSRYSSIAALVCYATAPIYMWLFAGRRQALLAVFIAILVYLSHRENIRRLFAGTESRIGKKK
jgi:acyl phosphate:glycerol-3-phosphate acyltransferase